jgi:endonuclease YncB( thermonuclease family)
MSTVQPTNTDDAIIGCLKNCTADVPMFTLAGTTVPAKVISCYDGDTFCAAIPLEGKLWKFNCRMAGYDTPEMKPPMNRPGRELEKARAVKAKQALLSQICSTITMDQELDKKSMDRAILGNNKIVQLRCKEFDKYGRLLVEIPLTQGVGTVNAWMVENGYGYAYDGGKKDLTFATAAAVVVAMS